MLRRILPIALLLFVFTAPAVARSLVIESFEADIVVHADGTLEVTEILRPRFTGSWNGIFRTIPVEYRHPMGFNYTLFLEVESVTDNNHTPLKYTVSRQRHYKKIKIWVPGARDATRTVILRYRVQNGLRFFEEHDELYWNVTGDEWEVPIESARAVITLPDGAAGVRTLTFTGARGSREQDADVQVQGNVIRMAMRRRLNFREGLTAVVGWDKGLVREPGTLSKVWLFLRSNWPFAIPLLVFCLMFWLWYTRGRDPRLRPIAARYAPPEGLTPAELGTLIDNTPDMRDITATIVDLAVRGYLVIEEKEEKHLFGLFTSKDYRFVLKKKLEHWDELKAHEHKLLSALFGGDDWVNLSDLENKFYKELPDIRDRIFEGLLGRHYYLRRPDKVRRTYVVAGVVLGFLSVWGGGMIAGVLGQQIFPFIASGVASGVIILAFGLVMPARTLRGARTLEGVLGFEEFLDRVESDRFDRVARTPEMFEKYLPYAMALGVEKNWVRAFEDIYRRAPEWYHGYSHTTFHPRGFVSHLGRMSSAASTAMASSPRSSGGSGFGGGGGGGGGFGGGGGGGF
jgi:uncharacterized membrane protein